MNKISRRNFLKVAGAGAAAMGLAACGGSSSSSSSVAASSTAANAADDTLSGTIEYWSSWSETENQALVLKQAADAFTQLHPNVKINFTFNGRDNRNLVVSAIEAGTQIDLMDANIDNVQKLWSENIKDLSSYIDKTYDTTNGKAYKDVVIPSMISLAGSLFDGKTMCIPYIPQAFMIFCNKGLLEECGVTEYPQTWEELMDACEKVKAAGHIPVTTDSNYCTSWVGYYMSRRLGNDRVMELARIAASGQVSRVSRTPPRQSLTWQKRATLIPTLSQTSIPQHSRIWLSARTLQCTSTALGCRTKLLKLLPMTSSGAHLLSRKFLTVSKARRVVATPPMQSQSIRIAMMLQHRQQSNSSFI